MDIISNNTSYFIPNKTINHQQWIFSFNGFTSDHYILFSCQWEIEHNKHRLLFSLVDQKTSFMFKKELTWVKPLKKTNNEIKLISDNFIIEGDLEQLHLNLHYDEVNLNVILRKVSPIIKEENSNNIIQLMVPQMETCGILIINNESFYLEGNTWLYHTKSKIAINRPWLGIWLVQAKQYLCLWPHLEANDYISLINQNGDIIENKAFCEVELDNNIQIKRLFIPSEDIKVQMINSYQAQIKKDEQSLTGILYTNF